MLSCTSLPSQMKDLVEDNRRILILYASETGNSEDLAKRIGWQAKRRLFQVELRSFDDYRVGGLVKEPLVLCICSTTGQGEEPGNMKNFWKFIRRKGLPKNALSTVAMAVIGLGDSSYQRYNVVGKKLFKRIKELGAKMLLDLCLGDEQHDLGSDATVMPWLDIFWSKVNDMFPMFGDKNDVKSDEMLIDASYKVELVDKNDSNKSVDEPLNFNQVKYDQYNPFQAKVLSNERVTPENHFQDVRLIRLKIDEEVTCLKYQAGDVCLINPENTEENVEDFISLLNLDKNKYVVLKQVDKNWCSDNFYSHLPIPCSVLELVTKYFDINSVPKRSFFELFWHFSQTDLEKSKLKEFASTLGQEERFEYCNRPRRTILEALKDFPNTTPHVPFEYLFDLIPAIKPRPFSIASALDACPRELQLLVAIVQYQTRIKTPRLGLCSNWLKNRQAGDRVPIHIRSGSMKLPLDSVPIIMIGPGTGVAPLRSFIQKRTQQNVGNNFLFFGCRSEKADFYFENEWIDLNVKGLLDYFAAFSRDDPDKKQYVQEVLWDQRTTISNLLIKGDAWIFVTGRAKQMPTQVKEVIIKILEETGGEKGDAAQMVQKWEAKGRLQFECWS